MNRATEIMQGIILNQRDDAKWVDAPLGKVKALSNTLVGDCGQQFVKKWCEIVELRCDSPDSRQSPWDVKIEGVTFEVKTATEDVNGSFQFNHIRYHREYQALLCVGIAPDEVLFHAWTKGDVSESRAGKLVAMDKNSSATFKLTKRRSGLKGIEKFKDHIQTVIHRAHPYAAHE